MLRKVLNKIFSSRVFYMLFSLIITIALWMYVQYSETEDQTFDLNNIQVVFLNEDVLRDKGLLISEYAPKSISLTVETSRSIASKLLDRGAVTAEIDLGRISTTGSTPLQYEIKYPTDVDKSSIRELSRSVASISLFVDRLRERPIPVQVNYRGGTASEELIAEQAEFDPRIITVEGPEDIISKIKYAYVPIPRENLSATFTEELAFVLFDENDEEIEESVASALKFSHDAINVKIPVRQVKNIPLRIELMHGAGSTDANTFVTYDPPFITVSGDPEVIREFNHIVLGTIDTTRFHETTTEAFPIIVPNHFTNLSGETEARVLVEVRNLAIAYFFAENLQYINCPPGHTATIGTRTLDVRIRGRREDLDNLVSLSNIRVVADLREYGSGTSLVPARVYVDGVEADVGAVGDRYRLTVTIERD